MQYIIYLDEIILIQTLLNISALYFMKCLHFDEKAMRRIIPGALLGTGVSMLFLAFGGKLWINLVLGGLLSTAAMLAFSFRCKEVGNILKLTEQYLLISFPLIGSMLVMRKWFGRFLGQKQGIRFALVITVGLTIVTGKVVLKDNRKSCKVILRNKGRVCELTGLLDTGNSLAEPISGKPVSVTDERVLCMLTEREDYFRVIPYHSIGCDNGIMYGYLIEEMEIVCGGMTKKCKNVYLAAAPKGITTDKGKGDVTEIIIHPNLLKESL